MPIAVFTYPKGHVLEGSVARIVKDPATPESLEVPGAELWGFGTREELLRLARDDAALGVSTGLFKYRRALNVLKALEEVERNNDVART